MKNEESDYLKFRGKCKEMSEELCKADPSLTLVRGHYYCPFWGEQAHWWTTKPDGMIVDPTAKQFPSKGLGEYVPFNGFVECAQCGKEMEEKAARFDSRYAFCSVKCNMRFVGL
jgi:hypothetical protein